MNTEKSNYNITLIVSDEENPKMESGSETKMQVVGVSLMDPEFKKPQATAARLCGGTSTCLAVIDLGSTEK